MFSYTGVRRTLKPPLFTASKFSLVKISSAQKDWLWVQEGTQLQDSHS